MRSRALNFTDTADDDEPQFHACSALICSTTPGKRGVKRMGMPSSGCELAVEVKASVSCARQRRPDQSWPYDFVAGLLVELERPQDERDVDVDRVVGDLAA